MTITTAATIATIIDQPPDCRDVGFIGAQRISDLKQLPVAPAPIEMDQLESHLGAEIPESQLSGW